jgi:hypothetical protein
VAPGYLGPSRADTRLEAWRALARRR